MRILRTKTIYKLPLVTMSNSTHFVTIQECQTYSKARGKKSIDPNRGNVEFVTTANNVIHVHFKVTDSDLCIATIQCNQK